MRRFTCQGQTAPKLIESSTSLTAVGAVMVKPNMCFRDAEIAATAGRIRPDNRRSAIRYRRVKLRLAGSRAPV